MDVSDSRQFSRCLLRVVAHDDDRESIVTAGDPLRGHAQRLVGRAIPRVACEYLQAPAPADRAPRRATAETADGRRRALDVASPDIFAGSAIHFARDWSIEHDDRHACRSSASSGVRPNPSYSDRKANTDARAVEIAQVLRATTIRCEPPPRRDVECRRGRVRRSCGGHVRSAPDDDESRIRAACRLTLRECGNQFGKVATIEQASRRRGRVDRVSADAAGRANRRATRHPAE